ncbi:STAS domain-containing protein [Streptomyces sp. 549]|uniref:STAS domain-containing protein n=1 Tax=Streptomyces sp. 549 TaxID=3049076 RepID=UPI0024C370CB|nr:STAS domain-containing protein [Streptomyces sp. 549]MDK1471928.1 STAS domain-containing protein [Streptomyces sp. 549]
MPHRAITVTSRNHSAGATVLTVAGELDHHTAPRFADALAETPFGPGTPVVLDLAGVSYCDSTGITVLVTAYRRAEETGCRLLLAGTGPDLLRVLQIVGLDQVFDFRPSTEQALDALRS